MHKPPDLHLIRGGCSHLFERREPVIMNSGTALITGCTSGIGYHLAHEFARHGHPLVLVAPVEAELRALAEELRSGNGIAAHVIARDLEDPESARDVYLALEEKGIAVDILVNNAGRGFRGKWAEIPIETDISMIRLNIEAVIRLTKLFIQPMLARGTGMILNTASIAGFEPGPLLATYHATKAFVLSWSEALATELEETDIIVTALCPGATDTDFFPKAEMIDTRAFQGQNVMAPQDVAKAGYEGLMNGDLFVVPGAMNKALVAARRVLSEEAQAKLNQKFYENVSPEKRKRERGDVEGAAVKRSD